MLPELDRVFERPEIPEKLAHRLDHAAAHGFGLAVRYAALVLDVAPEAASALAARVNAPSECRELAALAERERDALQAPILDAQATLALLERADAFRRPERLERLLDVAECDAAEGASAARQWLTRSLAAARAIDAGGLAREHPDDIPGAIRRARLVAIAALEAAPRG